jgi:membrane-associated phospholipid phosphatase
MALADIDRRALLAARTRAHPRWAERAIGAFSRTGEHAACWLVFGAVGTLSAAGDPPRRRAWLHGLQVVVGAYVLNYAVKITVRRHRPQLRDLPPLTPTVSRLSFPSAHATSSFAAARAFSAVAPAAPLYAVAGALALSRPYLGVHYPSDVLAGAVLGTVVAGAWPAASVST